MVCAAAERDIPLPDVRGAAEEVIPGAALILQGMGWGHMPQYLVEEELRTGRLLSIAGEHFKGGQAELVAARRRTVPYGPIANRLWDYIKTHAPDFKQRRA